MEDVILEDIFVVKRDGEKEILNIDKIHRIVEWAIKDIEGVTLSEIEYYAKPNWRNGITTQEIHNALIDSASNLISEESPNYQYVAAKLLNYSLRKEVWGGKNPPKLYGFIKKNIKAGFYTKELLDWYSEAEIHKIDEFINHEADLDFEYAAIKQLCDKYLIQDKFEHRIHETPQFLFILVAMTLFSQYKGKERMKYIKNSYTAFYKKKINLPTPILAGARTPTYSWASCCLIEVGDNLDSICASVTAATKATAAKYGIGAYLGNIRAIGSPIRGGETLHTGIIPYTKVFQAAILSTKQGGARRGAGTITFPIFHYEIESILELKNAGGTEDNRVRFLDYSITFSKLFYDRWLKQEEITLFSYHEVPELFDNFGLPEFDDLYLKAEARTDIKFKSKIPARKLFSTFVTERTETGRIYLLNLDHCNQYSPWIDQIKTSNLCQEILHPLAPFKSLDDKNGEIGVCVISAVNMLNVKSEKEHEQICDIIVRLLDELIDIQTYFSEPAKRFAVNKRSLGIGITNLAAYLASNNLNYDSEEAPNLIDEFMERQQYFLIKASVELAREKGKCKDFHKTKYAQGKMPLDMYYSKYVDQFITRKPTMPWDDLKKEIAEHGMRHATLSTAMPCESSSLVQNSTNGMEPIRELIVFKKSVANTPPQVAPQFDRLKNKYQFAFNMDGNKGYLKVVAAVQKWLCMACSTNLYYAKGKSGTTQNEIIEDIFTAYKYGIKSLYYSNTQDGDKQFEKEKSCESGACSL